MTDPLPFSLDWLAGATNRTDPLAVCGAGHLVVRGHSCWQPTAFSQDLKALWCAPADDCTKRR